MRYICEPDIDRRAAGWGENWWVIDTEFERPKGVLFLLPKQEAINLVNKLNGVPPLPYVSMTRKLMTLIFGRRIGLIGMAKAPTGRIEEYLQQRYHLMAD
jgi:hypothetical protein